MAGIDKQLSDQFHRWEMRGRGWQVYAKPVYPEPPFVPFVRHYLPATTSIDDGRKPTRLSSLVQKLSEKLGDKCGAPATQKPQEEPEPNALVRGTLVELQSSLPDKLDASRETFEQFLANLSLCHEPIAFELMGTQKKTIAQFVAAETDASLVRRQLQAFFPEAVFLPIEAALQSAMEATAESDALAVEFGLEREFMLPLTGGKLDPFCRHRRRHVRTAGR
jgi:hypothetical protein